MSGFGHDNIGNFKNRYVLYLDFEDFKNNCLMTDFQESEKQPYPAPTDQPAKSSYDI